MAKCDETRIAEKRFYAIPPQALTADGLADGTITVDSTYCWKVGQIITCVSSTVTFRRLKIKAVLSENIIKVGEIDTPIYKFSDVSDLLVADTAMIELVDDAIQTGSTASNRRPVFDYHEMMRAVYEEEPTIALRSHLVDWLGRSYCTENPIPVQLSDGSINIGTVNAELEVQLSHEDNVPDAGDVADSVQVGDGVEIIQVNPDGSINVNPTSTPGNHNPQSVYNEVTSVATGTLTTIATYTVPVAKVALLETVAVSGTNIAAYTVEVNATVVDKKYTWFNGPMSELFTFQTVSGGSKKLVAGDVVRVRVIHGRGPVGDFNAKIDVVEVG